MHSPLITFVDSAIASDQSLMASVNPRSEIILLDPYRDGLAQISDALAQRSNISSLHIISHGSEGGFKLGQTYYDANALSSRTEELASWSTALTDDADLLFYGCNVASGESGINFVNYLSHLTGADVAASDDLTGSAALGGDWDLEVTTGAIESDLALESTVVEAFKSVLPYLSDLTPTTATNGWGPVERDRANGEQGAGDGGVLTLNGVTYTKGLGVHAASDITYTLGGTYTRFISDIGVDDTVGSNGSVVFQVWADGVQLFDSGTMTGTTATRTVDIDVTGRQALRLVVTDGGNGVNSDHGNWANARLLSGPAGPDTTPPTATLSASNFTTPLNGTTPYTFTVTYTDNVAVSYASIDSNDLLVTGPNSFSQLATLMGVTPTSDNRQLTATYRIDAPGGNWNSNETGTYTIALRSGQVADTSSPTPNPIAASALGSFQVTLGTSTTSTYLSDLTPTTATNGWGPVERDRANGEQGAGDGGVLTLNGVTYTKGLGVHAASDITYTLGGTYTRFISDIGVDDTVGSNGSVVFQVWADGVQLFDSGTMTGTTATRTVDVDVTGRQALRLVVTDGGNGVNSDHGNWANARLLSAPAGPDTTPPTAALSASNFTTPLNGTTPYTFTVTYTDNVAVSYTSIDSNDLLVTGPNSFSQLATLVSVTPTSDNRQLTATYRIDAPGGNWNSNEAGTYTIALRSGQVADTSSPSPNAIAASTLGSFQVTLGTSTTSTSLSDLTPTTATNGWGPVERDRANGEQGAGDGGVLTLNGVTYTKGLGVHAASDITYTLGGTYTRFISDIGVDDIVGSNGSVVFQVWADGVQLFDSGTMTGTTATRTVDIDVTGRQALRLVVTDGGNGVSFDHANWADARLLSVPAGPDTTPPTASATLANVTTTGASTYDFTVTYTDNQSVNVSTIGASDVRVTGPNSFSQLATLVSVTPTGNGTPRTATYRITAPGGFWDTTDNGAYTVALRTGEVTDLSGNAVPAATLGTFVANITPPPPDTAAPTATLTAATLDTSRTTPYTFTVTYADATAVNVSTINSTDIRVSGPNGYSQLAQLAAPVTPNSNGTPLTATYQITAPDAIWNWNDRGSYTVTLLAGEVRDTLGNTTAANTSLGTFQVTVASTIVLGANSSQVTEGGIVTIPIQRLGDTTGSATVDFFTGGNTTAIANVNYVPIPVSTLAFAPGETQKTITVQTLNDGPGNANTTVSLLIENPTGVDLGPSRTSSIAIRDGSVPTLIRTYLSDLPFASAINGYGPVERDLANGEEGGGDGGVLTLNNVTYAKGIGVHAGSQITYNLGGAYNSFFAYVGVDDEVGVNGSVVFQILADGILLFDSGVMTGISITQLANVDVTGHQTLTLVVNDGGNGAAFDHANWADAQLVVGTYTPPPPEVASPILREQVVGGLNQPTTFDWSPDGQLMFIAEKGGVVRTFIQSTSVQFSPVHQYATGIHTHGIVSADLNRDGNLDLATANSGSNNVSVLLGNGNGTFAPAINFGVGVEPKSVVAADLNGDGLPDLFTANQSTNDISVLINTGNGTFASVVSYAGPVGAHEVVSADVDGDGDLDIAATGWGGTIVRVLRNAGNGTFSSFTDYGVGAAPHSLQLADFNGDGRPDLAVANQGTDNVNILLNTGTGAFSTAVSYSVGDGPHSIRAADLNGDGRIDLATANEYADSIGVLYGTGTGTFAPVVSYATGGVPKGIAIGDVNGDGRLDLLTANTAGNYPNGNNPGGNTISVLLGNSSGTFDAPVTYTTGRTPFSLTLADFNNDGRQDIATANWHTSDIGVLLNSTPTNTSLTLGLQSNPFIDISSQVNDVADRGLLGLEIDPFFGQNQGRDYIYLLFTYDPVETQNNSGAAGPDGLGNRPARLIRVTADPTTNYTTALPNSAVTLLGTNSLWQYTSRPDADSTVDFSILPSGIVNGSTITAPASLVEDADTSNIGRDYTATDTNFDRNNNIRDYLAGDSGSHSIGQIQFGLDGSLYVTVGDGTSYNGVDPRSVRVQDVDNLSGKLLRINPLTGQGYADNPFYNGDLDSNRSKVWSLGFRNAFRFAIQPGTGTPYLGDVGWTTWEEINVGIRGGNFGWPYFEGTPQNLGYSTLPQAQAFYSNGQTISPLLARNHSANLNADGNSATALIMGDFYTGNRFPEIYNGALFYNDVGQGTVYATFLNPDGTVRSTQVFDNLPYIVDMETGPDGNLYYANLYSGEIGRWRPA